MRSDGFEVIEGFVWCDSVGTVHVDSLDPYDYGRQVCASEDHRPIYREAADAQR